MKILITFGVVGSLLWASTARAATIDYSLVGSVDQLIGGFAGVGNSAHAEKEFLYDYLTSLGFDETELIYKKIDVKGTNSFTQVVNDPAGTNLWAIDFRAFGLSDPLAFVVKFGNAQYDHYLYLNVSNTQYGVVDLSEIVARSGNISISSLSHTSAAGGPRQVPEPGSASLLLLGAAAVVARSRKMRELKAA